MSGTLRAAIWRRTKIQEQKTAQGGGEGRPRLRAGLFNLVPKKSPEIGSERLTPP
jgi:hypothetical protein